MAPTGACEIHTQSSTIVATRSHTSINRSKAHTYTLKQRSASKNHANTTHCTHTHKNTESFYESPWHKTLIHISNPLMVHYYKLTHKSKSKNFRLTQCDHHQASMKSHPGCWGQRAGMFCATKLTSLLECCFPPCWDCPSYSWKHTIIYLFFVIVTSLQVGDLPLCTDACILPCYLELTCCFESKLRAAESFAWVLARV